MGQRKSWPHFCAWAIVTASLMAALSAIPAVADAPPDASALFTEGYNLLNAGKPNEAAEKFASGLRKAPKDPVAHYYLGECYWAQKMYSAAREEYRQAAAYDLGSELAAKMRQRLADLPRKEQEAGSEAAAAKAQGQTNRQETNSILEIAESARDRGDYAEAIKLYRVAAADGSAKAESALGFAYQSGKGVPADNDEAYKWYVKAANQGDAKAETAIGSFYENGFAVSQDFVGAAKWYRKAAEHGSADGQNSLAYLYQVGRGVGQSYAEALKWYRKAASQGVADAENNVGWMIQNGWGADKDFSEALGWYIKAAAKGSAAAQKNAAYLYEQGLGTPRNLTMALQYYKMSANAGDADAASSAERVSAALAPPPPPPPPPPSAPVVQRQAAVYDAEAAMEAARASCHAGCDQALRECRAANDVGTSTAVGGLFGAAVGGRSGMNAGMLGGFQSGVNGQVGCSESSNACHESCNDL